MKLRYLTFKDAPHLKDKGQPDEMIAELHVMGDNEKSPPKPWAVATPTQLAEYENSISSVILDWTKTQPHILDGKEVVYLDGKLQPRPSLEPINS